MIQKHKLLAAASVCAALVLVFVLLGISRTYASKKDDIQFESGRTYRVETVIDGDTFNVRTGKFPFTRFATVRMLGVDTPETVDPRKPVQCFGKEASARSAGLLGGKDVRLIFDEDREAKDKYGRYLAYVYLDGNVVSVNEELILDGFAREYTFGKPYSKQSAFREAERVAKTSERGLHFACR